MNRIKPTKRDRPQPVSFLVTWFLVLAVAEAYFSRAAQSRVSRMLSHVSWVPSFFSFW